MAFLAIFFVVIGFGWVVGTLFEDKSPAASVRPKKGESLKRRDNSPYFPSLKDAVTEGKVPFMSKSVADAKLCLLPSVWAIYVLYLADCSQSLVALTDVEEAKKILARGQIPEKEGKKRNGDIR